ncbi:MAG: 30S ribosomal protein S12 methylthiotransferase RimO [Calditrichaeota bacterium]|nr:30S ribosomal protein S12 methylthiotransferase RimO [Calditrichota bacterium]
MKIAYVSLGCPKNIIDLETILGGFGEHVEIVSDPTQADATLINTCAFIESSKRESIDSIFDILQIKTENPQHKVLVTGCLSQRYQEELITELPEVDGIFSMLDANKTAAQVRSFLQVENHTPVQRERITPLHYSYLRIAEGCNNRCSYCAIPLIKGRYQSRPKADILAEAQNLAQRGVKELIVVAQDTTFYGRDLPDNVALPEILFELNEIKGLEWIRLMYTHPAHWSDALIEAITGLDKVVKYIDLPIQHISDRVLKQMGRGVNRKQTVSLIDHLRQRIPGLVLRTSLIVGFPGETAEDFDELLQFIKDTGFERLGAFTYSHEEGTRAFSFSDDISDEVKADRQQQVMELQAEIAVKYNKSLIDKNLQVLIDQVDMDRKLAVGRTQWDAPEIDNSIQMPLPANVGEFYNVRVRSADIYDLFAELA